MNMDETLLKQENEDLKKRVAQLKKVRTGWMIAAIISFCLFAITLAIRMA